MAEENLGTAVLKIEVDIPSLEKDLSKARSLIEKQKPVNFRLDIGSSQQQFRKLETSAKTLEQQFQKLLATPLNLNSKNLEKLGTDALKAGTAINNYTRQVINGEAPLANSIASLQQQGLAFRTLAANVKVGTAEFTNFTQAALKASQKELFAGFQQAAAAQKLFASGGEGGVDTFKGTEQLLAYSRSIAQTPAAIQLYITALQQALSVTTTADSNFGKLSAEIEKQAAALDRAANAASRYNQIFNLAGQPKALPPGRGPSQFVFSAEETPEERRARERAERRAGKIQGIQTYASTGGIDPLAGFGQLLTKPNPEALRAEEELRKARLRTADQTLKAAADERKAVEATRKAGRGRIGEAASSALIGGGFPLLFGQGIGASVGGGIGGLAGGLAGGGFGFGASIVGTILGSVVDEALNKGKTLAAAFDDPIGKFGELQQAALLSSSAFEKNVAALIAQGRNAEAAAQIQLDLATTYGDTSELNDLRKAYDELGRAFNQLSIITAKYVAGPLTDFINKLAATFKAFSNESLFEERLTGASPKVEAEARARVRSAARELSGSGLSTAEVANRAYQKGLELLDERLGKTEETLAAERALAAAKERQNKLDSITTKQIQAQVQGYDLLNLQLEKQRIETQRLQDLQAAPKEQAGAINRKALEETVRVETQINNLLQDRAAQQGLEAAQNNIKLQSINRQVEATQALSKAERGVARDTLATTQNIQAGIEAANDREREIGAQIDAARQRGGDAGEQEAFRLVQEQKVAANQTRLELEKGALALKEAGEQLRDNLRDAVVEFTRVRSDPQGLNRFLNPQQRQQRAEFDFQTLLPQFREAQRRFEQLTGQRAPEFTGPTASVNEAIRDFILRTQLESQATRDLTATQQALNTNLEAYTKTIADLAVVTQELALKRWDVNLILPNGSSVPYANEQNAAFPL